MPTVPVTPRQELRPVATVPFAVPDSSGAQAIGRALDRASGVANEIVIREQQERNTQRVLDAETRLRADALAFENQVRERRGINADGVTAEAQKWWTERKRQLEGELENPAQREAFGRIVGDLQTRSIGSVERHELDERRQSTADAATASIDASIEAAAVDPTPERLDGAMRDIQTRTAALAALHGHTPERRAVNEAIAKSELHTRVLSGLADSDPEAAAAYHEKYKDQLIGPQRDAARKLVEVGSLRKRAQEATDELERLPLTDALAEARKRYSGEIEDEVVRRLKERAAERDAIRERGERFLADQAWEAFAQGGREAIPARVWANLDGKTRLSIEREASGRGVETDWDRYTELRDLAAADPARFAGLDLRKDFDKLAIPERRALLKMQTDTNELRNAGSRRDQLNAVFRELKLGSGKRDQERRGLLERALTEREEAVQAQLGRVVTTAERRQLLDELIVEGTVQRDWAMDDRRRAYELADEERARFTPDSAPRPFQPDIPPRDRAQIVEALRARGRPVTEANIRALYEHVQAQGAEQ